MSNYERLAVLVTLVLVVAGMSFFISEKPAIIVLAALLVIIAAAGTNMIVSRHPAAHSRKPFALILPAMLVLAGYLLLHYYLLPVGLMLAGGLAVMGILLALTVLGEYAAVDTTAATFPAARFGLNLIAYLVALVLYVAIYFQRVPALYTAAGIALVSGLLSLELLRGNPAHSLRRMLLYAGVVALILGELSWVLDYVPVAAGIATALLGLLIYGAILLLAFYFLTGLAQNYLLGTLNRSVVVEFSTVSLLGLVAIVIATSWLRAQTGGMAFLH